MIRHLPRFTYSGLSIILANPSRHDTKELLSGNGGYVFNEFLAPNTNRYCCDIRVVDDNRPLITGTKCLLLLGDRSLHTYCDTTNTLSEQRGAPIISKSGIPAVASYLPQDAVDIQAYEKRTNPEAEGYEELESEDKNYVKDKSRAVTARSNWRFWLKMDTKKALRILNTGILPAPYEVEYKIIPDAEEVITVLRSNKNKYLYIDIETDFVTVDMRCFAFSFGPENGKVIVYVVPTLDIHYKPAYERLSEIMLALRIGFRDNIVVAHNGCNFDFLVLAWKYRIPIGRKVWDTMCAQHRIYPEVEKSLGHCVSLWTDEPYHKNEAVHGYRTEDQAYKLYQYCGKDVFTMILIREAQEKFISSDPGLKASVEQVNASIRPYLITTLTGIRVDEDLRASLVRRNDKLMEHHLRFMKVLCGSNVEPLISNKRCVKYFHDQLGYPPVKRSKKTNKPSLDEASLYKLKVKHNNPVIDFLLAYRRIQKETGALMFNPWKL